MFSVLSHSPRPMDEDNCTVLYLYCLWRFCTVLCARAECRLGFSWVLGSGWKDSVGKSFGCYVSSVQDESFSIRLIWVRVGDLVDWLL